MRATVHAPSPRAVAAKADITARVAVLDWAGIAAELDAHGCATTGALLTPAECASLAGAYALDHLFRSRVVMARHGFGRGEYKYFAYPLPEPIAAGSRRQTASQRAFSAEKLPTGRATFPDFIVKGDMAGSPRFEQA